MIKSILLAIFLLVGVVFSADSCGPPQCYHPCTNAKPVVDFVFMIDVSGSMAPPIEGVKNGLASFVNGLGSNITPRYTLVIFGQTNNNGAAYIYRDATTSSSTFISDMTHWVTRTSGGVEPGLETILRALNKANRNNLNINYNVGQNNKKVFIVVTNEDSDPASSSTANLFSSNGYSQDSGWRDNKCKVATSNICPFPRSDSSISVIDTNLWNNAWQLEINAAANALIEADANVYMFVAGSRSIENDDDDCDRDVSPSQACNTKYQYCNPDRQSQNSTFGNFNAATTLNYMTADGTRGSLQDKLLTAGKIMRCFDVYDTGNSALVQNFFSEIVSDVSKCYTTCFDYICTSPTTCAPPVNRCGCDGVKYSNATYDPDGVCCVTKDCNGYCNNKYGYDDCGICTLGGANHPQCKTDCNGNQYLGFTSAPTGIKYQVQTINAAGYLLMNNDIKNAYVSTWRNVAAIQTHFHDYGVFEARSYCTFDLDTYNSAYSTSFSQSQAESDWLAKLLTTGPRNAQCAAGSRRRFPPLPSDQCGQCITNADAPPYCVKDCHNVWRGEGQQGNAYFTDNCGVCVAPGTDPNANKDSCGVCFGNDASKNECGECGGVKGNDACGQPLCENEPCNTDCDGVSRNPSTKNVDECGLCVLRESPGGAPGRDPGCIQDCAGNWYNSTSDSLYIIDECGNCVKRVDIRAPTCIQDCAGTWNGTAVYDACGQCVINGVTPHQCLVDCAGTHYTSNNPPPKSVDDCGICNTPEDANELKDDCGICTNLPGYNSAAECTPDCKGVYRLITDPNRAFTDACNVCWFANQTDMTNWHMDACGVCHVPEGPEDEDWNAGSGVVDSRGFPCSCGQIPAECSDGTITCVDSCPVYCPGTNNTVADGCGFCPGNPYYNKTDSCGLCCEGTEASPCDTALDSCGVCFGFDQDKQNPCGICDPHGTKCVQDCKGVWGGDAVVGCDGVCDSNAVCAVCGNGNIEDGETCDLGTTNGQNNNVAGSGCSPECQTESGGNVGAAIGGAIGGIAAIAALALAAFFAVRYAKKAGLIGNANKQVDFGASNSNPLYESQMKVQQNPLYESN